jgi:hypothetical protein
MTIEKRGAEGTFGSITRSSHERNDEKRPGLRVHQNSTAWSTWLVQHLQWHRCSVSTASSRDVGDPVRYAFAGSII